MNLMPGAILDSPLTGLIAVTSVGEALHANGYGPTEFRGFSMYSNLQPGTMVKTPWGMLEVVDPPIRCRLVHTGWDGRKTPGKPGSPASIAATLAAAKAMKQDTSRLTIEMME